MDWPDLDDMARRWLEEASGRGERQWGTYAGAGLGKDDCAVFCVLRDAADCGFPSEDQVLAYSAQMALDRARASRAPQPFACELLGSLIAGELARGDLGEELAQALGGAL